MKIPKVDENRITIPPSVQEVQTMHSLYVGVVEVPVWARHEGLYTYLPASLPLNVERIAGVDAFLVEPTQDGVFEAFTHDVTLVAPEGRFDLVWYRADLLIASKRSDPMTSWGDIYDRVETVLLNEAAAKEEEEHRAKDEEEERSFQEAVDDVLDQIREEQERYDAYRRWPSYYPPAWPQTPPLQFTEGTLRVDVGHVDPVDFMNLPAGPLTLSTTFELEYSEEEAEDFRETLSKICDDIARQEGERVDREILADFYDAMTTRSRHACDCAACEDERRKRGLHLDAEGTFHIYSSDPLMITSPELYFREDAA